MNSSVFKGFVKAAVILSIVLAVLYVVSYNKWLNRSFDDIDITYKDDEEFVSEVKVDKDSFKGLYNQINFEFLEQNYGEEFFDIYYQGEKFSNNYYLYVGIINLIKDDVIVNCNLEKEIPATQVDFKINEIFDNPVYQKESFTTKNGYMTVKYNGETDRFIIKINDKCSGFDYTNGGIKNEMYDVIERGDYLYIYEKALYLNYTRDSNGNIKFNFHNGLSSSSKVISDNLDSINMNEIETYKYSFLKRDDKYKLVSIEKD